MVYREKVLSKLKTTKEKFSITVQTLIIGAFAFAAALSWNDAIRSAIETLLPPQNNVVYKFTAAILITFLAVIVTYFIKKQGE